MTGWNQRVVAALEALAGAQQALLGPVSNQGGTTGTGASDNAATILAADATKTIRKLILVNGCLAQGSYSVDSGVTWHPILAGQVLPLDPVAIVNKSIQIKRLAGGTALTNFYVTALYTNVA